eukprot:Skav202902  [mRNA]  locus=scaffold3908:60012:73706:- [translate_table: standard]
MVVACFQEKMSLEFTQFLCSLLVRRESSLDLKAAICRTITWACSGQIHLGVLVPTLSSVLKQRNIFLKTCVTAPALLVEHLGIRDDDLSGAQRGRVELAVVSCRTTAQRVALQKCGAVEELVHLLQMTFTATGPRMEEMAVIIWIWVKQLTNQFHGG